MALYLAIWSPVMCCCAVKSGLGRVTGIEVNCCAALESCCTKAAPVVEALVASCCAKSLESDTPCEQPAHPDGCKCKERPNEVAPVKQIVGSPLIDFTHLLPAFPATVTAPGVAAETLIVRENCWRHAHGPPRESLFAHHCLLTV